MSLLRNVTLACFIGLAAAGCARNETVNAALQGAPGQAAPGSPQEFTQVVGNTVRFETDSAQLTSGSIATLDRQVEWLRRYGQYSVLIEGHADERGTREYNIALGARRAESVRNYLASRGVNMGSARTVSFGKERPIATCDNISCWSQNRRAVTVVQ